MVPRTRCSTPSWASAGADRVKMGVKGGPPHRLSCHVILIPTGTHATLTAAWQQMSTITDGKTLRKHPV
jgi:hypothetical protein